MFLRSLGLCAAFALAAESFLIPEALPNATIDQLDSHLNLVDPSTQLLTLPCPDCPLARPGNGDLIWVQGVENELFLNFSIGSRPSTLELNGYNLYPPAWDILPNPIYVYQMEPGVSLKDFREHPERYTSQPLRLTTFSLFIENAITADDGYEILPMTLDIKAIEGQPVQVSTIYIRAAKDLEGRLSLLSIHLGSSASPQAPALGEGDNEACKNWPLLCEWRNMVSDRINAMKDKFGKGCSKHQPDGHAPHHMPGKPPHTFRPPVYQGEGGQGEGKPQHPSHHHHHHSKGKSLWHKICHFLVAIVVPVLIGIAAGIVTYLVGMVLGGAIAFLYLAVRGSRRGEYESVAQDDRQDLPSDSDKEVYFEYPEIPAEAPPVYSEVVIDSTEKEVVP